VTDPSYNTCAASLTQVTVLLPFVERWNSPWTFGRKILLAFL
jgi:hypothetical protein